MYDILDARDNGSFVIRKNGNRFHVIPGMSDWDGVCTQAGLDPVAQAAVYEVATAPTEGDM